MSDTALGEQINAQIRATGPISLSTYMRLCLTHPTLGYYRKADPLGTSGDFITAPEISQLFGEMIGIFVAGAWQELGAPAAFDLVELGPGRGTLMADALRVLARVPGALEAASIRLIETNPVLIENQRRLLEGHRIEWLGEVAGLDDHDTPLVIIANEFFDALPIKQFQKSGGKWHERLVGIDGGTRRYGLSPTPIPDAAMPKSIADAAEGAVWENAQIAADVMKDAAARITSRRGTLLAIDYGYARTQTGDTFQAVAGHGYADPLARPGDADLTAHVDFEALAAAARAAGATALQLLNQTQFLQSLGIAQRAEQLAARNPSESEAIMTGLARLTAPEAMGELFKALCIASPGLSLYPFGPDFGDERR